MTTTYNSDWILADGAAHEDIHIRACISGDYTPPSPNLNASSVIVSSDAPLFASLLALLVS